MRPIRTARAFQSALLALLAWSASGYTPPPLLRSDINLQPSSSCRPCHTDITDQWNRSAHSKADRTKNPLFGRMYFYSLKQTRGGTMLACGPCHETASFVNQDFEFVREVSQEGVACVYCHTISGPGDPKGIPSYTLTLSTYHGTIRMPTQTSAHPSAYSPFYRQPEYCGTCHTYSNQHGVKISETYAEWKRSRYAKLGTTCQSCHMPGGPGHNSSQGPVRPRVADHSFDEDQLAAARPNAATLSLTGGRKAGVDSIRVMAIVTNTGWGHALPTGNDQNLALIRIRVLDSNGKIVWENDPFSEWNVSVFGLILADELGNWPADTWNAVKTLSDRRIQAGASARVRYDIPVTEAKGALRVQAQLLYRRAKPMTITAYGLDEHAVGAERTLAEATLRVP
ncbi:MAG TPA: multiheme c-type cytochrome [Candidatus Limnocylindrales bacterium]|nr:multiheme c-type cytochrome [Candidatus Limnocylindrales bacterium]